MDEIIADEKAQLKELIRRDHARILERDTDSFCFSFERGAQGITRELPSVALAYDAWLALEEGRYGNAYRSVQEVFTRDDGPTLFEDKAPAMARIFVEQIMGRGACPERYSPIPHYPHMWEMLLGENQDTYPGPTPLKPHTTEADIQMAITDGFWESLAATATEDRHTRREAATRIEQLLVSPYFFTRFDYHQGIGRAMDLPIDVRLEGFSAPYQYVAWVLAQNQAVYSAAGLDRDEKEDIAAKLVAPFIECWYAEHSDDRRMRGLLSAFVDDKDIPLAPMQRALGRVYANGLKTAFSGYSCDEVMPLLRVGEFLEDREEVARRAWEAIERKPDLFEVDKEARGAIPKEAWVPYIQNMKTEIGDMNSFDVAAIKKWTAIPVERRPRNYGTVRNNAWRLYMTQRARPKGDSLMEMLPYAHECGGEFGRALDGFFFADLTHRGRIGRASTIYGGYEKETAAPRRQFKEGIATRVEQHGTIRLQKRYLTEDACGHERNWVREAHQTNPDWFSVSRR